MSAQSFRLTCLVNVRNGERFLEQTLHSLVAQRPRCRVVVVDNRSTDGTAGIVGRFVSQGEPVEHRITPESLPLGAARNYGLERVGTEYVAWVDGDDLWLPEASAAYHDAFREFPFAVAFSAGTEIIDEEGTLLPPRRQRWRECGRGDRYARGETLRQLVVATNPRAAWCSYVFSTDAVRRGGGFDARLTFSEDFDLIGKVLLQGMAVHLRRNLSRYRVHGQQVTRQVDPATRYDEVFRVACRLGREGGILDARGEAHLKRFLAFKHAVALSRQAPSWDQARSSFRRLVAPGVLPWLLRSEWDKRIGRRSPVR